MPPDVAPFAPKAEYSCREFVMTALAGGFAAAVVPVSAQTITTDNKGLTAGEVGIRVADGEMPAYRAMPAGGKDLPTVLVVQEIFGVHEHIRDLCRRLAKEGYLAIAPELYARQGDVSKLKEFNDIIAVVNKVPDVQVMSDLDATAAWAANNGGNADKMAVTGFCWGGRITWMYAAHNPKLNAGVALVRRSDASRHCAVADPSHRYCRHPDSPGAGLVRRGGYRYSCRYRGENARGAQGRRKPLGNRGLCRYAARFPRRLSPQLPPR